MLHVHVDVYCSVCRNRVVEVAVDFLVNGSAWLVLRKKVLPLTIAWQESHWQLISLTQSPLLCQFFWPSLAVAGEERCSRERACFSWRMFQGWNQANLIFDALLVLPFVSFCIFVCFASLSVALVFLVTFLSIFIASSLLVVWSNERRQEEKREKRIKWRHQETTHYSLLSLSLSLSTTKIAKERIQLSLNDFQ